MPLTNHLQCYITDCEHRCKRLRCYDTVGYEHCKYNPFRRVHDSCNIGIFERVRQQAQLEFEIMEHEQSENHPEDFDKRFKLGDKEE